MEHGQYRITELRPGAYTVTFTLPGFNAVKRDGINLTGAFTASVDAELRVGALEETITVTGEAPIVDVQSATRQRVMDADTITALPTGRNMFELGVLIPGAVVDRWSGQPERGRRARARNAVARRPRRTARTNSAS